MFNNIDLRELAQISGPERAFVSLYLANQDSYGGLKGRIDTLRALLQDDPAEAEHFEENLKIVEQWLAEHTWETEGVCLFVCYAKEIVDVLTEMDQKEKFDRLFLVGSQETMVQIESKRARRAGGPDQRGDRLRGSDRGALRGGGGGGAATVLGHASAGYNDLL